MSLDINWSLLSTPNAEAGPSKPPTASYREPNDPLHPSAETLTNHLISVLNTQLASTKRPSFIGTIEITQFDFGSTAPEVEIKDIRDVWRAFDEDDEEEAEGFEEEEILRDDRGDYEHDGQQYGYDSRRASGRSSEVFHPHHQQYQQQPHMGNGHRNRIGDGQSIVPLMDGPNVDWDDTASVFSSNRRQSIHAVGLGARGLGGLKDLGLGSPGGAVGGGYGHPNGLFSPGLGGVGLGAASVFSHPLSPRGNGPGSIRYQPPPTQHTHISHPPSPARPPQIRPSANTTSPNSTSSQSSSIPSLQLHLSLTHTSDLTLTLLTSLIVNYPSSVFMSLPLKLSITGLQLAADLIVAFDGEKKRIHLTIIDDDYESNAHSHGHPHGGHGVLPVGQRLLPEMRIDSEIGHSDAHVLRNVGKVERFIADVVRKTLVDELVFPNFHTIAL